MPWRSVARQTFDRARRAVHDCDLLEKGLKIRADPGRKSFDTDQLCTIGTGYLSAEIEAGAGP
jgi:hypothetical protein